MVNTRCNKRSDHRVNEQRHLRRGQHPLVLLLAPLKQSSPASQGKYISYIFRQKPNYLPSSRNRASSFSTHLLQYSPENAFRAGGNSERADISVVLSAPELDIPRINHPQMIPVMAGCFDGFQKLWDVKTSSGMLTYIDLAMLDNANEMRWTNR